jgi:hypothetical protein
MPPATALMSMARPTDALKVSKADPMKMAPDLGPGNPVKKSKLAVVEHTEFFTQEHLPINSQILQVLPESYAPIENNYKADATTSFTINVAQRQTMWLDPAGMLVTFTLQFRKAGANLVDGDKFLAEPFLPFIFFKQVDIWINEGIVPDSPYYSFKNIIPYWLNMSEESANCQQHVGFYPENTGRREFGEHVKEVDNKPANDNAWKELYEKTPAYAAYMRMMHSTRPRHFIMNLGLDVMEQTKMIPPNVRLGFRFFKQDIKMCIRAEGVTAAAKNLQLKLDKFKLHVKWYELHPESNRRYIEAIAETDMKTAKYPILAKRVKILQMINGQNMNLTSIFSHRLPRRVIIYFLENKHVTGTDEGSSFIPKVFKAGEDDASTIRHCYLQVDGIEYPRGERITYDFSGTVEDRVDDQRNMMGYYIFKQAAIAATNPNPYLSLKRWETRPMFAFDLTCDENAANASHYTYLPRVANVNLKVELTDTLNPAQSWSVVIYYEQETCMEIPINSLGGIYGQVQ